jgi:hypothetical protein
VKERKTMPPPSPEPLSSFDSTCLWGNKRHTIRFSVNMMQNLSGLMCNLVFFLSNLTELCYAIEWLNRGFGFFDFFMWIFNLIKRIYDQVVLTECSCLQKFTFNYMCSKEKVGGIIVLVCQEQKFLVLFSFCLYGV